MTIQRACLWALALTLVLSVGCSKKESGDKKEGKEKEKPAREEPRKEPARGAEKPGEKPASPGMGDKKITNKLIVWTLGSKLSLTALGYARGVGQPVADRMMKKCRIMAKALGTMVPPLFKRTGNKTKDSAAALHYVLKTAGRPLGMHIKTKYGVAYMALFEVAMKSNLLHFLYMPSESKKGLSKTIRVVVEKRAKLAGLPDALIKPLCDKMKAGAPTAQVTAALKKMHKDIKTHVAVGK